MNALLFWRKPPADYCHATFNCAGAEVRISSSSPARLAAAVEDYRRAAVTGAMSGGHVKAPA